MPKFEPKQVQKDLEAGTIWPVYWIYGQERMKSRELLKRIRKAVTGTDDTARTLSFNEETLDGTEVEAVQIVDAAQALSLGGGTRFITVRDAHAIKDTEALVDLLAPCAKKEDLGSVCVFLSKDLDGRKKFSKTLLEKAAVVSCEEIQEEERDAWIGYLAKRRGITLAPEQTAQLRSLDPWTLDIIDQELEKYSIAGLTEVGGSLDDAKEVLMGGVAGEKGADAFLEAFLGRDLARTMTLLEGFADSPEEALPLLGLLGWNVRQLVLVLADRENGTRTTKLSPFLADRFTRWTRKWNLSEGIRLQTALAELDFELKQTPRLPLGVWTNLTSLFCRS